MFHSRGTVQTRTCVPVGTSCTVSSRCSPTIRNVSRTPSPVMLRHSGYNRRTRACMSSPRDMSQRVVDDAVLGAVLQPGEPGEAPVERLAGQAVLQVRLGQLQR